MHLRQIKDSLPVAVEEMGVGEGTAEALEAVGVSLGASGGFWEEEGETKAAAVGAQAMGPPNPHMVPLQTNPAMVPRNQAMEPLVGARALEVWV